MVALVEIRRLEIGSLEEEICKHKVLIYCTLSISITEFITLKLNNHLYNYKMK